VLSQGDNDGFRATQMIQDKAQPAENGMPFSRAAPTVGALGDADWIIWVAPFGRAGKQSLARRLKRLLSVRSTASRLAETIIITLSEHPHAAL
jgi:hypothetical protein